MHVAIYGSILVDTVMVLADRLKIGESNACCDSFVRPGGIANFARALANINTSYTIIGCAGTDNAGRILRDVYPDLLEVDGRTSRAVIIVDKATGLRTNLFERGVSEEYDNWAPVEAEWHHIAYLDQLRIDLSKWRDLKVSADVCSLDGVDIDNLRYVDCLFLADDDRIIDPITLPVPMLILHGKSYIEQYIDQELNQCLNCDVIDGLNVLGAGDYLSAFVVANIIDKRVDFKDAVANTVKMLRAQS